MRADCKALQEEVDRKNQELKGKSKEEWNAYVKFLDGQAQALLAW